MTSFRMTSSAAVLFLTLSLIQVSAESVDLNLHLQAFENARPPEVFNDLVIFSYRPAARVFIVGARFSHEKYEIFHTFRKNENGVYVLSLPLPASGGVVRYRFMVDGVWMADPANPASVTDERGVVFSLFSVQKTDQPTLESPRLLGDGYVEFTVAGQPGELITIAGDFNNYNPFTHRLSETQPGVYSIKIKLLPGRHLYYFVLDGVSFIDPLNERVVIDVDRHQLSVVTVP
ncbi:MAG: glycogen-binding domain-containing protein [Spirochaetales bacterium]|nr:glycogen-binding domain-containing protein [Spirochaetales bacterium]